MNLSQQTYDALMAIDAYDMSDTEFHVIFDIWSALTNNDMSPKNPAHGELVSHLASELQI